MPGTSDEGGKLAHLKPPNYWDYGTWGGARFPHSTEVLGNSDFNFGAIATNQTETEEFCAWFGLRLLDPDTGIPMPSLAQSMGA